ncbi:MAG: hypothetical protein J6Q59_07850, partial [Paludibacteraceae bacterium]|nr:hypothetical protein [Paludibacteraceae bacterium]
LRREKFDECGKVFGSNPKGFELLIIYLAMFLRTSSLKRLKTYSAVFRRTQLDCGHCRYCPSVFWRGYW